MSLEHLDVGGIRLDVLRHGAGRPLLVLHGEAPLDPGAPVVDLLGTHAEVIAPTHPGFGHSARPDDFDTVYDLVHLYLDLLERLPPGPVTLMGLSFGGWLAAEITADILDVFNTAPAEVERRRWHEPAKWAPDPDAMSNEALVAHARNREALCLYAWHPYMYNPRLSRWLPRITVPTLVLWGASDGIVTPAYGRAYTARIPAARFELIEAAGHHPEIEQPGAFVERVRAFLSS